MKKIYYGAVVLFLCIAANAQVGQLDNTFTRSGFVKTSMGADFQPNNNVAYKAFPQEDGKTLIVYESAGMTLIAKKNADGTTDVTYRNGGFSTPVRFSAPRAVQQADGKIVITGFYRDFFSLYYYVQVARFNVDGTLDKTFDGDGLVTLGAGIPIDLVVQPNGEIIVLRYEDTGDFGEYTSWYVNRLTAEGVIDPTFHSIYLDADIAGGASSITLLPDGKFMLGGLYLRRYNNDGTIDYSFGDYGAVHSVAPIVALNILNSGKILTFNIDFGVTRYLCNGTVDNSFGINGTGVTPVPNPFAKSMVVQCDGKILVAGITGYGTASTDFAVVRYTGDGFTDNSFSSDGIAITDFGTGKEEANCVALLNDGRILAAGLAARGTTGYYDAAITRLDASGNPDNSFDGDSKLIDHIRRTNSGFNATAVQPDGKIVCGGYAWNGVNNDFMVVRYNSNGILDNSFSGNGRLLTRFGVDAKARGIAVQSDGKIIAVGSAGGDFGVVRYNADGSPDNSFGNNGKVTTDLLDNTEGALAVLIQCDGKILVSGKYAIVRYNTNGTLDNSFDGDGKVFTGEINSCMAIQADGKILVANSANSYFVVWRLNIDGSLDHSFGEGGLGTIYPAGGYDAIQEAKALAVLPDGRIIIGGTLEESSKGYGYFYFSFGVLTADGLPAFNEYTIPLGQGSELSSIVVQNDGKIIMAGEKYMEGRRMFAILRLNADFSIDNSFGNNGVQYTSSITTGESMINALAVDGNRLYAAGYGQYPAYYGVLAAYKLPAAVAKPKISSMTAAPAITIKISPNPAKNVLQFKIPAGLENEKATLQLIGINGKKWKETVVTANKNSVVSLDISTLSPGMYILNVVTRKKLFTSKFTKE